MNKVNLLVTIIISMIIGFTGCTTTRHFNITSNPTEAQVKILTYQYNQYSFSPSDIIHEDTTPTQKSIEISTLAPPIFAIVVEKEGYERQVKMLNGHKSHNLHFDFISENRDDDTIVLNNKTIIHANITEISSREIRYRPANQPEGLVRVLSTSQISEIIYSDGTRENYAKKTSFGISADPSGFALYGPDVSIEINKGRANTQLQVRFPSVGAQNDDYLSGLGIGLSVLYVHYGRSGGFYFGGIGEYSYHKSGEITYHNGAFAASTGYKFVHDSGANFRLGFDIGGQFGDTENFVIRPVTAIGWKF
ncbi:MAG: hypothetical protein FWG98_06535 [Candidatus Cloacimonetes bacterium]|nr:hypothetical protein [Candidatus Cloacimonadota bacterium]